MDERISKALAELRRAGISPLEFATKTADQQEYTNQEIADLMWEVAKTRIIASVNEAVTDKQYHAFSSMAWWLASMVYGNPPKPPPKADVRSPVFLGGMGDYIQFSGPVLDVGPEAF